MTHSGVTPAPSKHRILYVQICVRQTVRMTRKPGRLQNLATDAGICAHCTRHGAHVRDTGDLMQHISDTWASIITKHHAVGQ